LENLVVSGRHACLIQEDQRVTIEDLDSTNGTYVNGRAVKKQVLQESDTVEIGNFKIIFSTESSSAEVAQDSQKALLDDANWPQAFHDMAEPQPSVKASIKVVSGPAAGREMPLTKTVTTFGKPGIAVAAITRRDANFYVHHVDGAQFPVLNGTSVGQKPVLLRQGDQITVSGTVLQFLAT
jgi:pSer/pThr/pTyr-binding forkhead associated (FHA) protein